MNPQVKKEHYFRKKYDDLGRFISYYYQIDLARSLEPESILEVGVGNGTVSDYLKKAGHKVTTVDVDPELKPDRLADVRKLPFGAASFDAVLAYEILEHLPFSELEKALGELKRVSARHVLISLPYRSTGFELALKFPWVRTIFSRPFLNLFFRIPLRFGGFETSGQHYWEIDSAEYSLRKVRKIIKKHLKIKRELRPVLNHYHYFFVLEK